MCKTREHEPRRGESERGESERSERSKPSGARICEPAISDLQRERAINSKGSERESDQAQGERERAPQR